MNHVSVLFCYNLQAPGSGGFVGCVRDLRLNEAPAGSPAHSQGTVPCFQDPLQPGAYFSGQGGNMAIGDYQRSSSVVVPVRVGPC